MRNIFYILAILLCAADAQAQAPQTRVFGYTGTDTTSTSLTNGKIRNTRNAKGTIRVAYFAGDGTLSDTNVFAFFTPVDTTKYVMQSDVRIPKWDTAYNKKITGVAVTGTTTKTITLTQQDAGTVSNTFSVSKSDVSLGNVDNTSDANKPISTATQTALNTKHTQGGDSRGAPIEIGSNDLNEVRIRTNGFARTIIDTAGTVGIYTNKDSALNIRNSGVPATGQLGFATAGNPLGVNTNDFYMGVVGTTPLLSGYIGLNPAGRTFRVLNMSTMVFGASNQTETATLSSTQATGVTTGWNIRLFNNSWNLVASKTMLAVAMGNTYNQTAGAGTVTSIISTPLVINSSLNAIVTSFHANPTFPSFANGDYRAFLYEGNNGSSLYSSGTAPLRNVGAIITGSLVNNGDQLQVTGNAYISGRITQGTISHYVGAGTPEGTLAAPVGSTYCRTDGGANTTFYVKQTGTGNTGWAAK